MYFYGKANQFYTKDAQRPVELHQIEYLNLNQFMC